MLREFLLLFVGQQRCFDLIHQLEEFVLAALLIYIEPITNGGLDDEQGLSNIGDTPTATVQNDRLDAICKFSVAQRVMQQLQSLDLFG